LGKSDINNILKIHLLPHRKRNVSITKTSRSIPFTTVNSVHMEHMHTVCGDKAAFIMLNQTPNVGTTALCSWLYQNFTGSRRPVHVILNNQLTLYALARKFLLLLLCWPELDHCRFSGRSLDGCQRFCRFCEKKTLMCGSLLVLCSRLAIRS